MINWLFQQYSKYFVLKYNFFNSVQFSEHLILEQLSVQVEVDWLKNNNNVCYLFRNPSRKSRR